MQKIKDTIIWQEMMKTIKANSDFINVNELMEYMKKKGWIKKIPK